MVDANILFRLGTPANVQTAQAAANELAQMPIRNQLLEAQAKGTDLQNQKIARAIKDEDAMFVLKDVALDAMDVMPIIKRGNMAEFSAFMDGRIRKIEGRGGDATESRAFKEQMESGLISPDVALERLQSAVEKARQAGVLEGASSASMRSYEPRPMLDENGNFAGYAIPIVDAAGNTRMQPIPGSERAMSPIDLAAARENIGVQGYGQRRQIEAQTAPIIAGGAKAAELDVEGQKRPQIEADITKARAEAEDLVQQTISKRSSSNTLGAAQVLRKNLTGNLDSIYGRGESLYPNLLRSQKGIDLIADRDQLVGMLTLAGRGQLKGQGPLTDQEQKTVQQAITVLSNPDISPARAEIALNDAFTVLETSAGRPSTNKENQDTFEIDGVTVTRTR